METAYKWSGIQPQRGCSGQAAAERPGNTVQQVAWHAATWMNALYINARHLSNQLDLASVTEACLMRLSSTEYAFFPDTRRIYLTVWLHHAAFFSVLVRWFAVCLRPAMTTPAVFASFFGKLEKSLADFAKSIFAGGSGMTRRQELLSGVRFCSAAICKRTSLWSLSACVSSCPKVDWVWLISVDGVKEKTNNSAQTFLFLIEGKIENGI